MVVIKINFDIEGEEQEFPNIDLKKIKNPITKFFFQTWLSILNQNGIQPNDPRFNEVLDVIKKVSPSVSKNDLEKYEKWMMEFGST